MDIAILQTIWKFSNTLAVGAVGFLSALITALAIEWKKDRKEMCQRVYEPLRQELERNLDKLWACSQEGFDVNEWARIHKKEYWSFKIKPNDLREKLTHVYTWDFHNMPNAIGNAECRVYELIKQNFKIDLISDYDGSFHPIILDLVTYENKLNYPIAFDFRSFQKKHNLKPNTYDEFRSEIIKLLKKDQSLNHFWDTRKKFAKKLSNTIKLLEKKLKIKSKPKVI